jgi:hypothetical protein
MIKLPEPVGYSVPQLQTFKGAKSVHFGRAPGCTASDAELIQMLEGTVVRRLEVFSDLPPVTDKHGVTHYVEPVYSKQAIRDALEEAAKVAQSEPRVWDLNAPDPQHRIATAIRTLKERIT